MSRPKSRIYSLTEVASKGVPRRLSPIPGRFLRPLFGWGTMRCKFGWALPSPGISVPPMDEMMGGDSPPNDMLLKVLQAAVAVALLSTLGLYLKGNQWAREAALVNPLTLDVQRNELAVRSLLFEAYQWNQTHQSPELTDLLRRLNVTVQSPSAHPVAPASPPKAPNR